GETTNGIGGSFESTNGYSIQTSGKIKFAGNGVGIIQSNRFLKSINSNGDAEWSNLLPYSQTTTATTALLKITNTSTSGYNGIQGETFSSGLGFGIHGIANSTTPSGPNAGVWGKNSSTNSLGYGVGGTHSGTGAAVRGETTNGIGGSFESTNGYSIQTSGKIKFAGNGVGIIQSNRFLKSINSNGDAEWSNLLPYSQTTTATTALLKITNTSTSGYNGIQGETFSSGLGFGIHGIANSTTPSGPNAGVWGKNSSTNSLGYGVGGTHSGTGAAVRGETTNGIGGSFESTNGYSIQTSGKIKFAGNGVGIIQSNRFLKSINSNGDAEWSNLLPYSQTTTATTALLKITNTSTSGYNGIQGETFSSGLGFGIHGIANSTTPSGPNAGVWGENNSTNSLGYGVGGVHHGMGAAVKGETTNGIGGHFTSTNNIALITDKGKIGFGNTAPSLNSDERVEINGRLRIRDSTSTAGVWFNNSANGIGLDNGAFYGLQNNISGLEKAGIWIGSAWRFTINRVGNANFTGTVTATGFPIASDFRYKKNIQPLENTLSKVQKIVGVSYDLRKDEFPEKNFSDKPQIGFIAQDLEKIFPEMVFTDEKCYKSVDYARLTPVLVEAMKELILKNQTLENKNQTLESRLDKIEAMLSAIQPNTENLNSKK
ncbi:tail fiber domain-containing protein, partial [Lacihabitans soyangensis]